MTVFLRTSEWVSSLLSDWLTDHKSSKACPVEQWRFIPLASRFVWEKCGFWTQSYSLCMKLVCKNSYSNVCYSLKHSCFFLFLPLSLIIKCSVSNTSQVLVIWLDPYTDRLAGWNPAKAADAWRGPTLIKIFQYCLLNYYVMVNKLYSVLLVKLVTAHVMYYSKWLEPSYIVFCLKATSLTQRALIQPVVNCCFLLCRVWLFLKK